MLSGVIYLSSFSRRIHWDILQTSHKYITSRKTPNRDRKSFRTPTRAMSSFASGRRQVPNPHMTEVHPGVTLDLLRKLYG